MNVISSGNRKCIVKYVIYRRKLRFYLHTTDGINELIGLRATNVPITELINHYYFEPEN